jgi:hypothetical protein
MRLSFDAKQFDKGNKENATASLGAFVPGTQADHLFHRRDESFGHEQDFVFLFRSIMILLPGNNRGHKKGKGCPPNAGRRSRRSHLRVFNIFVVLALVFAGYLPTTQAVSDSTDHLVHEGPATRTLYDSAPTAFSTITATIATTGDASFSVSSATVVPNAGGFLLDGEDQQQHLDAAFQAPLIQAEDTTVNVQQGKDVVSINEKVRNHHDDE